MGMRCSTSHPPQDRDPRIVRASASHENGTEHPRHFRCIISGVMRYLVKARVKSGQQLALVQAIDEGILGQGSIAGEEYLQDMGHARFGSDGAVTWVEVCFVRRRWRKNVLIGRSTSTC